MCVHSRFRKMSQITYENGRIVFSSGTFTVKVSIPPEFAEIEQFVDFLKWNEWTDDRNFRLKRKDGKIFYSYDEEYMQSFEIVIPEKDFFDIIELFRNED